MVGNPRAARAVGTKDFRFGGAEEQKARLETEGVLVGEDLRVGREFFVE